MKVSPITMAATGVLTSSGAKRRKPKKYIYKAMVSQLYPYLIDSDIFTQQMLDITSMGFKAPVKDSVIQQKLSIHTLRLKSVKIERDIGKDEVGTTHSKIHTLKINKVRNPIYSSEIDDLNLSISKIKSLKLKDVAVRNSVDTDIAGVEISKIKGLVIRKQI